MSRGRLLWACAALAALVAAGAYVGPSQSAARPLDQATLEKLTGEDWYAISLGGQNTGYGVIRSTLEQTPAGQPQLVVSQQLEIKLRVLALEVSGSTLLTVWHDQSLTPLRYHLDLDQLGQKYVVEAVREGNLLRAQKTVAGNTTSKVVNLVDDFGSDSELSLRALRGELKPGDTFQFAAFDPWFMDLDQQQVSVGQWATLKLNDKPVRALEIETHSQAWDVTTTTWLSEAGQVLRMELPTLMNMVMTKVTEEEALAKLAPLQISASIPVAVRLPEAGQVSRLTLRASSSGAPIRDLIPASPRQKVTVERDQMAAAVAIAAEKTPNGKLTIPVREPAVAAFVAPTEFIQSSDPALVAKAKEIVGSETNAWRAAQKIREWVYRNMTKRDSYPKPITARECLEVMEGDCSEHAMLFVGLARAASIPAQFVAGVVYSRGAFWYHAWVEVYVAPNTWVAVDPTWNQAIADATHISLAEGVMDSASFARVCLAAARTMGALKLEIREYRTTDGKVHKVEAGAHAADAAVEPLWSAKSPDFALLAGRATSGLRPP